MPPKPNKQGPNKPTTDRKVERLAADEVSFLKEAEYIVKCAQAGELHIVGLGAVVFFSLPEGDAWMIDTDDFTASCLALDGKRQPFRIIETETQCGVDWDHDFTMVDGDFVARHRQTGKTTRYVGLRLDEMLKDQARYRQQHE